jgi:nicotinate-nucleotide pyrophosphorylase (carboxylating)
LILDALKEDIGEGDHSSLACIAATEEGSARLEVREAGIIAGIEVAQRIFELFDSSLKLEVFIEDGSSVKPGDIAFIVRGAARSILTTERLVLNIMQRMSGIATKTNQMVKMIGHTHATLLDTRKTTPNFRLFEKQAVLIGGGGNHRFGLYDMVMIKDNHIDFAGGITAAITKTKKYLAEKNIDIKIIVEARSLQEIKEILSNEGVYRILIDNFNYEDTKKAVALIGRSCLTESSGGINETTIRKYADCGVDYISSGALTHSVYNLDLSLKAVDE